MESKIMAGIVTFNPEINRLNQNIEAIAPQVDELIIVDNGSKNITDINKLALLHKMKVLSNVQNLGIAAALNQIFRYYDKNGG